MEIALRDEVDENNPDKVREAWKLAYQRVPEDYVAIEDIANIIPDKVERSDQGKRHWTWYTKDNHP